MKQKNIFVYGTLKGINEPEASELRDYCRQLGRLFAEAGHSIIVVSSIDSVVDPYFIEGAESSSRSSKAIVCRSNDPEFPFYDDHFKGTSFTFLESQGQLNNSHISALRHADIVLTIAGTHPLDPEIGYQTMILGKPILALPFFGHGARRLWDTLSGVYRGNKYLKDSEIGEISKDRSRISPDRVCELMHNIMKRHEASCSNTVSARTVLFSTVLLITLLVMFLIKPTALGISYEAAFFFIIGSSSMLGILLRVSRKIVSNDMVTRDKLTAEISTGLILGLVFSLAWIVNNYLVTGNGLSFINGTIFSRVAIVCSLITTSAAYLLESSVEKVESMVAGFAKD